jgi:hypothetical protein
MERCVKKILPFIAVGSLLISVSAYPLAVPAFAQFQFGIDNGPDFDLEQRPSEIHRESLIPYAQAIEMALSSSTWAAVKLSTAPALELTQLMNRGYYRLELIELTLLAERANVPFGQVVKQRDKGKSLVELADQYRLDESELYTRALALRRRADAFFPILKALQQGATTAVEHPAHSTAPVSAVPIPSSGTVPSPRDLPEATTPQGKP